MAEQLVRVTIPGCWLVAFSAAGAVDPATAGYKMSKRIKRDAISAMDESTPFSARGEGAHLVALRDTPIAKCSRVTKGR